MTPQQEQRRAVLAVLGFWLLWAVIAFLLVAVTANRIGL